MNLHSWRITALVTSFIVIVLTLYFTLVGWNGIAIKHAIDATGRSSLILFAIAFTASSLESLWASSITRWPLRNRRWGVGTFGSSLVFFNSGALRSIKS